VSTERGRAPIDWTSLKQRLARAGERLRLGGGPTGDAARAVLEARGRALAAPPQRPAGPGTAVVAFSLGGERYALDAVLVRELVRAPRLARLPGAPAFLVGLANLRGEVLDVLDLRPFLGAAGAPVRDQAAVLVLGTGRAELGLQVDEVEGLSRVDPAALVPAPEANGRTRPEYVRGVTRDGLALLDGAALLADPRLVVDDAGPRAPLPPR
jgi:purine-binding chemotaxis protein CheW